MSRAVEIHPREFQRRKSLTFSGVDPPKLGETVGLEADSGIVGYRQRDLGYSSISSDRTLFLNLTNYTIYYTYYTLLYLYSLYGEMRSMVNQICLY